MYQPQNQQEAYDESMADSQSIVTSVGKSYNTEVDPSLLMTQKMYI